MIRIEKNKKGFTLIELLVVVAIIGILAAIAIPQFSKYRTRAYNSAAQSDLRNVQTSFEGYFADYQEYPDAIAADADGEISLDSTNGEEDNVTLSASVGIITAAGTNNASYAAVTKHLQGDQCYQADSDNPSIAEDNATVERGDTVSDCTAPSAP
jgi:prepilin-type N-terminal cleavage/methylation domain-containing protein